MALAEKHMYACFWVLFWGLFFQKLDTGACPGSVLAWRYQRWSIFRGLLWPCCMSMWQKWLHRKH